MKQAVKGNEGKTVYISHDSIGYLADRYNFKQEGIENMNAEEPSQKDLTNIVKQIKEDKVKYILAEENVSNKVADTVRKETDAKQLNSIIWAHIRNNKMTTKIRINHLWKRTLKRLKKPLRMNNTI